MFPPLETLPSTPLRLLVRSRGIGNSELTRRCKIAHRRTVLRWWALGRMDRDMAEMVCHHLGLHPLDVWDWDTYYGASDEATG